MTFRIRRDVLRLIMIPFIPQTRDRSETKLTRYGRPKDRCRGVRPYVLPWFQLSSLSGTRGTSVDQSPYRVLSRPPTSVFYDRPVPKTGESREIGRKDESVTRRVISYSYLNTNLGPCDVDLRVEMSFSYCRHPGSPLPPTQRP